MKKEKTKTVASSEDKTVLTLKGLQWEISELKSKSKKSMMDLAIWIGILSLLVAVLSAGFTIKQWQLAKKVSFQDQIYLESGKIAKCFDLFDSDSIDESMIGAKGLIPFLSNSLHHEAIYRQLASRALNMTRLDVRRWTKGEKEYMEHEIIVIKPFLLLIDKLPPHEKYDLCRKLLLNRAIFFSKFPVLDTLNPIPTDDIWKYLARDPEIAFRKGLYKYLQNKGDQLSLMLLKQLKIDTIKVDLGRN